MRLVFDIETNPIDFSIGNHVDQVHTVWCIVAQDVDTGEVYEVTQLESQHADRILELLEEADELIGHNIIQFDIPVLRKLFGLRVDDSKLRDTLVISRTLYPDRPGGHSLGAWGERLGNYKSEFGDFSQYSEAMLQYCKQDVRVNLGLLVRLEAESQGHDWSRALELEHRIADIIARQERIGFKFHQEKAEDLIREWTTRISNIDSSLNVRSKPNLLYTVNRPFKINGEPSQMARKACDSIGLDVDLICGPFCSFNYTPLDLNSKAQQKQFLLENGWKPQEFTPSGQPKLDDSILKVEPIGPFLHERNVLSHRLSQVQGLLELSLSDGRIHGGANPCGTPTGRMRHSRIVNIPRVSSPHGKELRSLFTATNGKVLVGYDAASLELRILAHYIGDGDYTRKVTSTDKGNDAHVLAARAAGTDNRDTGKTINYALIYGAGDYKLGSIVGGGKKEGKAIRAALYKEIPGLEQLIKQVERASKKGYLLGLDNRKLYLRDKKSALNTLIQGGGAVFMKTVTELLDRNFSKSKNCHKVVDMHDEAQWEIKDDPIIIDSFGYAVRLAFDGACNSLQLRCPQEPEIKVGKTWAETH